MSVLCTGSIAIDHIMVFEGRFKDVILPEKIHMLNVAFHVPDLNRSFGGTAANIGFNLKQLGEEPIVLGTVGGMDFGAYAAWFERHGIALDQVHRLDGEATAGAYITTDLDRNQIVGFHPGAMDRAHEAPVSGIGRPFEVALVSPNGKRAMQEHARALKAMDGVMTIVDPGQGLPLFDRDELLELLSGADLYIVNDYEWQLTLDTTGESEDGIRSRVGRLVVTRGGEGSTVWDDAGRQDIAAVAAAEVVDPTGCGDAYRAGLVVGLRRGMPLAHCAQLGSVMGSLMAERAGTQSLELDRDAFAERVRSEFGLELG